MRVKRGAPFWAPRQDLTKTATSTSPRADSDALHESVTYLVNPSLSKGALTPKFSVPFLFISSIIDGLANPKQTFNT